MRSLRPEQWMPIDGLNLEPAALHAVQSEHNVLVTAGPGAGKTELLAQRASYLLMTGSCPPPQRILAISFKRDAARNLRERVSSRCVSELAIRFDSYTYDSFAKSLVDRFRLAIPEHIRPGPEYDILTGSSDDEFEQLIRTLTPHPVVAPTSSLEQLTGEGARHIAERRLSASPIQATDTEAYVHQQLWERMLAEGNGGFVTFAMLQRLADVLLRANPHLLCALRATYSHVFLDEFQDTTSAQYGLLKSAFEGSQVVLTAVGDHKQGIMGWAGAKQDVFDAFVRDFNCEQTTLCYNHRAAPALADILRCLVRQIGEEDDGDIDCRYRGTAEGTCEVWMFNNERREATYVAEQISSLLEQGHSPRDVCVIFRIKPDDYAKPLLQALANLGIRGRVENKYQDLLAEPLAVLLVSFLRLATGQKTHGCFSECLEVVALSRHGCTYPLRERSVRDACQEKLTAFVEDLGDMLNTYDIDEAAVREVAQKIIRFIGRDFIRQNQPRYRQERQITRVINGFSALLAECSTVDSSWHSALDELEGFNSVPMMTIHKSKGLEYRAVFFIGLEDSAFWNFAGAPEEEQRNFFVAFSRAMDAVYFTFCRHRSAGPSYRSRGQQSMQNVSDLYDMLVSAGVAIVEIDDAVDA